MKKTFVFVLLFSLLSANSFAAKYKRAELTKEEKEQLIINLNYVRYSTAMITTYQNKEVAESQRTYILNRINPNSFVDDGINEKWTSLLKTLTKIQLSEEERDFINQMAAKQRKQAFTKCFQSFGSVFVPGASPQQLIASLVYSATAAAFNYLDAVNSINDSMQSSLFQIYKTEMKAQNDEYDDFFNVVGKIVPSYEGIDNLKIIAKEPMLDYIKVLENTNNAEKLSALESKKQAFEFFPPYWFELGTAYLDSGKITEAIRCYDQYEKLYSRDVVSYDTYYLQILKNRIRILLGDNQDNIYTQAKKNKTQILAYLNKIEKENKKWSVTFDQAKNNYYMAQIYYIVGEKDKALDLISWILENKRGASSFIEDAITLMHLIKTDNRSGDNIYYVYAQQFSEIPFGDNSDCSSKLFNQINKASKGKMLNPNEYIYNAENVTKVTSDKNLYWLLPPALLSGNVISAKIDDVEYIPEVITAYKNYQSNYYPVCIIDYPTKNIKTPKNLLINAYSYDQKNEFALEYNIVPITKSELEIAEKALNRIGSDISTKNGNIILGIAQTLKNYKYVVDDINKEKESIRNTYKKEDKKNKKVRTESEMNEKVDKELNKRLGEDIKTIKEVLSRVEGDNYLEYQYKSSIYRESYSKPQKNAYASSIAKYNDKYFIISLVSVYSSKDSESEVQFTSVGYINKVRSETEKTLLTRLNVEEMYQDAVLGNAESQFVLGKYYYEGVGNSNNNALAMKWLYRAAIQGHKQACAYLAEAYKKGIYVPVNAELSSYWMERAF